MSIFRRSSSDLQLSLSELRDMHKPTSFDPKTVQQIRDAYAKEAHPPAQRNGVGAVAQPGELAGR